MALRTATRSTRVRSLRWNHSYHEPLPFHSVSRIVFLMIIEWRIGEKIFSLEMFSWLGYFMRLDFQRFDGKLNSKHGASQPCFLSNFLLFHVTVNCSSFYKDGCNLLVFLCLAGLRSLRFVFILKLYSFAYLSSCVCKIKETNSLVWCC